MEIMIKRTLSGCVKNLYQQKFCKSFTINEWFGCLKKDSTLQIRFMGVDTQAQSQSGNTVIRGIAPFIHDKLIINNVEKMHEIMKENQLIIVLIDDFLGSGDQLHKFYNKDIKDHLAEDSGVTIVYCPLIAMRQGIESVKNGIKDLRIFACETIDANYQLFHPESIKEFLSEFGEEFDSFDMEQEFHSMRSYFYGIKKTCGLDEIMRCLHWVLNGDAPTKT